VLENEAGAFSDSVHRALSIEERPAIAENMTASAAAIAGLDYFRGKAFIALHQYLQAIAPLRRTIAESYS
jgi:hypothetical protein